MDLEQMYRIARRRHGDLGRDVVHDLIMKFGNDLPSDAYLTTCIYHAKTLPAQEIIEVEQDLPEEDSHDPVLLAKAIRNISVSFELEVDTFLECEVNSTYKKFSEHSGISLQILKKICMFAKTKIHEEYSRLSILYSQHI